VNSAVRDAGSGKPPRRLPRPRLLSVALAIAGVTVILAGYFLQGSTPAIDPSPPLGYGSVAGPGSDAVPTTPTGYPATGSTDAGLRPGTSDTEVGAPEADPTPATPVPVSSGRLEDLPSDRGAVPERLVITALGIDAPILPVGVADGVMEVPPRADVVGWYRFGPTPGEPGSAVLAAHVSWGGALGVFYRLRDLPQGSDIEVWFTDGSVRRFRSVALAAYDKAELPVDGIFSRLGEPALTLVTCGGAFNESLRRFEQNVVAYAVAVDEADDWQPIPGAERGPS
jgi:hypothetical protein